MIELSTNFNNVEKELLKKYNDVSIKIFIDKKSLFEEVHSSSGSIEYNLITNPNRMIYVSGYLLLETKDELEVWYIGSYNSKENTYVFWGKCDTLENALNSL